MAETVWRAATAVMFGTDPQGATSVYVQHVHYLDWRISEATLLVHAMPQLAKRSSAVSECEPPPWQQDRLALTGPAMLNRLARLLAIPARPSAAWRAAVVITYMPSPLGVIRGHIWFLQNPRWPLPDDILQDQAQAALARRYEQEAGRT